MVLCARVCACESPWADPAEHALKSCFASNAGTNLQPRSLSYNPAENAVLVTSDVDGGSYELFMIPKDANGAAQASHEHALSPRCLMVEGSVLSMVHCYVVDPSEE